PSGGFLPMQPKDNVPLAPSLRATSAAVRSLHYLGGVLPNKDATAKFVASCHDAKTGGFADMPGKSPEVFSTAIGVMGVTGLKVPLDKYEAGAIQYMSENAKSFE